MAEVEQENMKRTSDAESQQNTPTTPSDAADTECGARAGRRWAIYKATAVQLSVLAAMAEEYDTAEYTVEDPALFLDFCLALTIGDVYGQEFMDARSYRSIFPKPAPPHTPAFLRAFLREAVAVWQLCKEDFETE